MIIKLAKMGTGLMARGGAGAILRLACAAPMLWAAWLVYAPIVRWTEAVGAGWELLGGLAIGGPAICGLCTIMMASERRSGVPGCCCSRPPWGMADFLRREPFVCWCLMTDDGKDVPLWAILVWPLVAVVEVAVFVWLLIALPFFCLYRVAAACGRAAWRVLSVRPLDRGR